MLGTFIAAIALLAAMLYLIVRPFIWAPKTTAADVAHEAIAAPEPVYAATAPAAEALTSATDSAPVETASTIVDADAAVSEVAASASTVTTTVVDDVVPTPVSDTTEPPTAPASGDDVRLRVEALIAARKAEMTSPKCPSCATAVTTTDAFCRTCGTKLT